MLNLFRMKLDINKYLYLSFNEAFSFLSDVKEMQKIIIFCWYRKQIESQGYVWRKLQLEESILYFY